MAKIEVNSWAITDGSYDWPISSNISIDGKKILKLENWINDEDDQRIDASWHVQVPLNDIAPIVETFQKYSSERKNSFFIVENIHSDFPNSEYDREVKRFEASDILKSVRDADNMLEMGTDNYVLQLFSNYEQDSEPQHNLKTHGINFLRLMSRQNISGLVAGLLNDTGKIEEIDSDPIETFLGQYYGNLPEPSKRDETNWLKELSVLSEKISYLNKEYIKNSNILAAYIISCKGHISSIEGRDIKEINLKKGQIPELRKKYPGMDTEWDSKKEFYTRQFNRTIEDLDPDNIFSEQNKLANKYSMLLGKIEYIRKNAPRDYVRDSASSLTSIENACKDIITKTENL